MNVYWPSFPLRSNRPRKKLNRTRSFVNKGFMIWQKNGFANFFSAKAIRATRGGNTWFASACLNK